jgi:N-acetyl-alpha-D-glucosaminyl L-malate synthase BshA
MDCKLLLVGDGPERNHVEAICRSIGYCDDIRFLGKQEAVEELLAIADLFVLPSESESFGLAALEAMACEVPVISSNTGGIPEININGQTGFMSDVGDIHDMAKNALYILQDDEILKKFKANALEQAKKFNIHQILPMYENYYVKVLEQASAKINEAHNFSTSI